MADLHNAIMDQLVTYITADLITPYLDSDPLKLKRVQVGALQEDPIVIMPWVVVLEHPDRSITPGWHGIDDTGLTPGSSLLHAVEIGGAVHWTHWFIIKAKLTASDRATCRNNQAALRHRLYNCLRNHADLAGLSGDDGEYVVGSSSVVSSIKIDEQGGPDTYFGEIVIEVFYWSER